MKFLCVFLLLLLKPEKLVSEQVSSFSTVVLVPTQQILYNLKGLYRQDIGVNDNIQNFLFALPDLLPLQLLLIEIRAKYNEMPLTCSANWIEIQNYKQYIEQAAIYLKCYFNTPASYDVDSTQIDISMFSPDFFSALIYMNRNLFVMIQTGALIAINNLKRDDVKAATNEDSSNEPSMQEKIYLEFKKHFEKIEQKTLDHMNLLYSKFCTLEDEKIKIILTTTEDVSVVLKSVLKFLDFLSESLKKKITDDAIH